MKMTADFANASDVLAQYDALAARPADVTTPQALAMADALANALRAALMTSTALAPRPKRAKAAAPLAFDMGAQSFARALRLVMRASATGGRYVFPILSAVRLDASGDVLRLTCSDVDREISVAVEAPGVGDWAAAVNAKALAALVGKAKGQLEMRRDGEALHISGAVTAILQSLDVANWPRSPAPLESVALPIQPDELRGLLAFAAPAVSTEETRYYLNGAFMHVNGAGQLAAVATDGHRLHRAQMDGWKGLEFPAVIIPRATVADMLALLATPGEAFAFNVGGHGVTMTMGPVSLASKVIDGSFPDYVRVIPSRPPHVVEMAAADLDAALSKAAALKDRRAGASAFAQLIFAPGGVEVTARNADGVTLSEHVKADDCRCSFEFGFNVANLREAIKSAGAERVAFHISGENDAVIIADAAGDGSRVAVVMPMRR